MQAMTQMAQYAQTRSTSLDPQLKNRNKCAPLDEVEGKPEIMD
jgi:hypothetical protein